MSRCSKLASLVEVSSLGSCGHVTSFGTLLGIAAQPQRWGFSAEFKRVRDNLSKDLSRWNYFFGGRFDRLKEYKLLNNRRSVRIRRNAAVILRFCASVVGVSARASVAGDFFNNPDNFCNGTLTRISAVFSIYSPSIIALSYL